MMAESPHEHAPRFDELLPAYALGALDGEEVHELEEHIATGCAECRRQIDLWQGDLEELAASVPPLDPAPETRRKILEMAKPAAVRSRPEPRIIPQTGPARRPVTRWLALAASVFLAVAVWGVWRQDRLAGEAERLRSDRDNLARQVAALDRRLGEAQSDNRRLAQTLSLITAPGARAIQLAGLGPTPGAVGHAFVNPQAKKAIFYAFDLPPLPPDKTYELWWIAPGRPPVPAGTFGVDAHGASRVEVDKVDNPAETKTWAVTIEPAGGVAQPSGAMVLKG
jgi:anti-sigma-K factor RskA